MSARDPLPDLLIAIPVVILVCQAGAQLFRRFGQPPVIGEITLGIMLGPSLLGWVSPAAQAWLFPESVLPFISAFGNIGLLAFMFLIGLELDLGTLRGHRRTALAVSQASIALPLVLGSLLAFAMFGSFAPPGVGRLPFVLFIAVSMSITAFPVLARVLTDRGLVGTRIGSLAMACAAVDDVTAWCLLAAVVAVSTSGSPAEALTTAALAAVFLAVMIYALRPLLARWAERAERVVDGVVLVVLFSGLCLSALATDRIGVHALFGAFVFGLVTPRGPWSSNAARPGCARSRFRFCCRCSSSPPGCTPMSHCWPATRSSGCGRWRYSPSRCSASGAGARAGPGSRVSPGATPSRSGR